MKGRVLSETAEDLAGGCERGDLDCECGAGRPSALPSAVVGRVVSISDSGYLVDFPGNDSGELVCARSLVAPNAAQLGHEAALVFENGDSTRPIVLGVFANGNPKSDATETAKTISSPDISDSGPEALVLTAGREITLRCGKASITLTSAGKVLLRGAYLLSRSSGVNRIKGGSVQIN